MSKPAFPVSPDHVDAHEDWRGLTMRDYFAAKALQAIVPVADDTEKRRGNDGVQAKAADYAQIAYALADEMMKAREVSR